jgi:hypothetical protein
MKIKIKFSSGFVPESAQNQRFPYGSDNPDPPSGPPGGREDEKNIKSVLKYSWAFAAKHKLDLETGESHCQIV